MLHKSYSYKVLENIKELQGKTIVVVVETTDYLIFIFTNTILILDRIGDVIRFKDMDNEIMEALFSAGINTTQLI